MQDLFIRDDVVELGWTEDGDRQIGLALYLVARATDGRQWAHDFCRTAPRHNTEAAFAQLERLRAKVAAHLEAGGRLDPEHWVEIDPAYGSAAYQRLDGQGYFRAAERQRARDAGEHVLFDEPCDAWFAMA